MKVLICAGDVIQAAEVRDTVEEVIEKDMMTICYTSRIDTYAVQTRNGSKAEIIVYLLPDWKNVEHMQRLESLREKIVEKLSLTDFQVICASKFP